MVLDYTLGRSAYPLGVRQRLWHCKWQACGARAIGNENNSAGALRVAASLTKWSGQRRNARYVCCQQVHRCWKHQRAPARAVLKAQGSLDFFIVRHRGRCGRIAHKYLPHRCPDIGRGTGISKPAHVTRKQRIELYTSKCRHSNVGHVNTTHDIAHLCAECATSSQTHSSESVHSALRAAELPALQHAPTGAAQCRHDLRIIHSVAVQWSHTRDASAH